MGLVSYYVVTSTLQKCWDAPDSEIPIPVSSTMKTACVDVYSTCTVINPVKVSRDEKATSIRFRKCKFEGVNRRTFERIANKVEDDLLPETEERKACYLQRLCSSLTGIKINILWVNIA